MNDNALSTIVRGDLIASVDDLVRVASFLVKSGLLPSSIKTPEAAAAIILKGRELGIGAMEAFSGINVIQGKPTVAPQLMMALINRSGQLEDLSITDDGKTCTVTMTRKGRKPHTEQFGMDDAARMMTQEKGDTIPLANKYNWRQMPAVMRKWRAISACARVVFPDVIAGMYLPEEMGLEVNDEGEIVEGEARIIETEGSKRNAQTVEVADTTPTPKSALPPVDVGVKDRGTVIPSKDGLRPLVTPPAPLWTLVERARASGAAFKTPESQENGRGMLVSVLDDYAGDTQRRHSFLSALFPYSKGASKNLSAADLRALLAWKDAADAKSEVNRVINDYLKAQGQTEMELAA